MSALEAASVRTGLILARAYVMYAVSVSIGLRRVSFWLSPQSWHDVGRGKGRGTHDNVGTGGLWLVFQIQPN